MTIGGDGTIGCKRTEEQRRKISKSLTGKHLSAETRAKQSKALLGCKRSAAWKERASAYRKQHPELTIAAQNAVKRKVLCVELNQIYNSLVEAAKATGAQSSRICLACKNNNYRAAGYHWKYLEEAIK